MRVFLTGSHDAEWRWNLSDFFQECQIEFFDSFEYSREFSSIFKLFRILEGCDGVIACFSRNERQHLETALELSYASKLAKEILVVDHMGRRQSWIHSMPYSLNFSSLDGLKAYLTKMIAIPQKTPRLLG